MKTRLVVPAPARLFMMSGALVLTAALMLPGAIIATDADGEPIDPAVQADMLADHFRCEHQGEMTQAMTIDPAVQADMLADHFRCEHQGEMTDD